MRCAPRWTGPATVARIERSEIRRGPCGPASDLHRCDGLSATLYEMEVSRRQVRLQYVVQQQLIAGTEVDQRILAIASLPPVPTNPANDASVFMKLILPCDPPLKSR